jgi:hypothetical protein
MENNNEIIINGTTGNNNEITEDVIKESNENEIIKNDILEENISNEIETEDTVEENFNKIIEIKSDLEGDKEIMKNDILEEDYVINSDDDDVVCLNKFDCIKNDEDDVVCLNKFDCIKNNDDDVVCLNPLSSLTFSSDKDECVNNDGGDDVICLSTPKHKQQHSFIKDSYFNNDDVIYIGTSSAKRSLDFLFRSKFIYIPVWKQLKRAYLSMGDRGNIFKGSVMRLIKKMKSIKRFHVERRSDCNCNDYSK